MTRFLSREPLGSSGKPGTTGRSGIAAARTFQTAVLKMRQAQRDVLITMTDGEYSNRQLAETLGRTAHQVSNALTRLLAHGFVERVPPRKWVVTDAGRTAQALLREIEKSRGRS